MREYRDGLILIDVVAEMVQTNILQNEDSIVTIDYGGDTLQVEGDKRSAAILILQFALKKDYDVIQYSFNNFTFKYEGNSITVEPRWKEPSDLVLEMVDHIRKVIKLKAFL